MPSESETIRPRYGELLTAHEALELVYRLREALEHDVYAAQVLIRNGTWEEIAVYESLIGTVNHLRTTPVVDRTDAETKQRNYIGAVANHILGISKQNITLIPPQDRAKRVFRVKKMRRVSEGARKW